MKKPKPNDDGQCQIKIFQCQECNLEGAVRGVYPIVGRHNPQCHRCGARAVKLVANYRFGASE